MNIPSTMIFSLAKLPAELTWNHLSFRQVKSGAIRAALFQSEDSASQVATPEQS